VIVVALTKLHHAKGHDLLIMEPRNGKLMRHIYPKANSGTAKREVRDPHGGVPKGTQPKSHAITDAVSETRPLVHETKPPPVAGAHVTG
jgi:hypothetical protein